MERRLRSAHVDAVKQHCQRRLNIDPPAQFSVGGYTHRQKITIVNNSARLSGSSLTGSSYGRHCQLP